MNEVGTTKKIFNYLCLSLLGSLILTFLLHMVAFIIDGKVDFLNFVGFFSFISLIMSSFLIPFVIMIFYRNPEKGSRFANGLYLGGVIGLVWAVVDFILFKTIAPLKVCSDACGIDNMFFFPFSVIVALVGRLLMNHSEQS